MARVTHLQTNFTAGELSPRLSGRVDIARYTNGAKRIENAYPLVHGGAIRRPGSRFITGAKLNNKRARLIPFIFNKDQAYILEFGDLYMRVFTDGAQVLDGSSNPYEIVTPYSEAMLSDIDYVQGADTMFLAHPDVPIHRLRRLDHDNWILAPAPFVTEPFAEIGHRPATTLTLSSAAVGSGRTLTAGAAAFIDADVGRDVWAGAGIATITGYTSATVVTATITSAFESTSIAADTWTITGSPQGDITPSLAEPVGATITLTAKSTTTSTVEATKNITGLSWALNTATFTVPSHGYSTGNDVQSAGNDPAGFNGTWDITVLSANTFSTTITPDPGAPVTLGTVARSSSVTNVLDTWRAEDVGKFVQMNGGLVEITQYISPTQVAGILRAELDAAVYSPANAWTLESHVWNDIDGYPRTVSLHEQRLVAAGSPGYPQTVWMSRIGESLNFELGTRDDDAMSFTISSDQINPIAHVCQVRALLALTYGGEFTMAGGVEKPITPTNIQVKNQSVYGCNSVRPVRIGNELYFVQRANRKLRALAYKFETDAYGAPDLSVLAEHMTESGIVDMAYQQEPESIIWMVRANGGMATLTIDRDQDVVGWARQITDGAYESVATIPVGDGEEVWTVVNRTIQGATKRYIERMDADLATDCAIEGTSVGGAATWTGLGHLEGKAVDILADGVVMPRSIVTSGEIVLPRAANAVQIGLPYTSVIELMTPELASGVGSAQGNSMRVAEITVRFLETTGAVVNGQVLPFRRFGEGVLDSAPPIFTGDLRVENLGWERGRADVVISQPQPLPFHVLCVIKKLTVND